MTSENTFFSRRPRHDLFHPVLPAAKLGATPVRITVAGKHYALFRDAQGRPAAVVDRCPHRFAALSGGRVRPDGRIACPYHGWHFDREGRGRSPSQPNLKRCDVPAMQVVEYMDYLWLGEPATDLGRMPSIEPSESTYEFAGTFALQLPASLEHALDIFSDAEHPAWVHGRLAWDENHLADVTYTHDRGDDRSTVQTSGTQRATWMSRLLGLRSDDRFNNHWVTRFDPVRAEFSMFWTNARTGEVRPLRLWIALFLVPVAERETALHAFVFVDLRHRLRAALLPVLKRLAVRAGRREANEDRVFLKHMEDAAIALDGARLGRLDAAISHNRRLLGREYFTTATLVHSST